MHAARSFNDEEQRSSPSSLTMNWFKLEQKRNREDAVFVSGDDDDEQRTSPDTVVSEEASSSSLEEGGGGDDAEDPTSGVEKRTASSESLTAQSLFGGEDDDDPVIEVIERGVPQQSRDGSKVVVVVWNGASHRWRGLTTMRRLLLLHSKRRIRIAAALVVLVLLAVVIGASVGTAKNRSSSSSSGGVSSSISDGGGGGGGGGNGTSGGDGGGGGTSVVGINGTQPTVATLPPTSEPNDEDENQGNPPQQGDDGAGDDDDDSNNNNDLLLCGCAHCQQSDWDAMAGDFSCGERIEWLLESFPLQYPDQVRACRRVAFELPCECGACDPARCDLRPAEFRAPAGWTPDADAAAAPTPAPRSVAGESSAVATGLYCFPTENQRTRYTLWDGMIVEVKTSEQLCGPGNNRFTESTVQAVSSPSATTLNNVRVQGGDKLTLQYKNGMASEVRIVRPNNEPFTYGTYSFSIESIAVKDAAGNVFSNALPKELVLGLFTWDDTEDYAIHENWNHEVDIEISRWNCETNADVQFLVQPPGYPQMHRFFSGGPGVLEQSPHQFAFTWNPGRIDWFSTAGGGQSYALKTEEALYRDLTDYVQCMPDRGGDTEVRINLWNMLGAQQPVGLRDTDLVEVVIDNFSFTPSDLEYVEVGGYCSKHCQCDPSVASCISGICTVV